MMIRSEEGKGVMSKSERGGWEGRVVMSKNKGKGGGD
jgi:hypothetical protein